MASRARCGPSGAACPRVRSFWFAFEGGVEMAGAEDEAAVASSPKAFSFKTISLRRWIYWKESVNSRWCPGWRQWRGWVARRRWRKESVNSRWCPGWRQWRGWVARRRWRQGAHLRSLSSRLSTPSVSSKFLSVGIAFATILGRCGTSPLRMGRKCPAKPDRAGPQRA
jgi:hypothetical protein